MAAPPQRVCARGPGAWPWLLLRVGFIARQAACGGPREPGLARACEFLLVLAIVLQLCEMQRNLYADAFPYVDDLSEPFRKPVEKQLAALPGEHLVLVRYSKDHNSGEEYVYNDADIDHAKTVWAREIPGMDLAPLFQYFRNRDVWLYEPDEDDSIVQSLPPSLVQRSSAGFSLRILVLARTNPRRLKPALPNAHPSCFRSLFSCHVLRLHFRRQRASIAQQIRAVAPRFFQGFLQAPAANFFVISAEQNFRHVPAAKFRGARVVGAVEEEVTGDW